MSEHTPSSICSISDMDQLSNFTDHSEQQQFPNFDAPIYNTPFDPNEFSNLDRFLNVAVIK